MISKQADYHSGNHETDNLNRKYSWLRRAEIMMLGVGPLTRNDVLKTEYYYFLVSNRS